MASHGDGGCRPIPAAGGFTLVETVLVLLLIALFAALVVPPTLARISGMNGQRRLIRMAAAVESLRDRCFTSRTAGEVAVAGPELVLSLGGRRWKTFALSAPGPSGRVRFNGLGMSRGGRLRVDVRGWWTLVVPPGNGRVVLMTGRP